MIKLVFLLQYSQWLQCAHVNWGKWPNTANSKDLLGSQIHTYKLHHILESRVIITGV